MMSIVINNNEEIKLNVCEGFKCVFSQMLVQQGLFFCLNSILIQGRDKNVVHVHVIFLDHADLHPSQNFYSTY